jgi:hypothetical protein
VPVIHKEEAVDRACYIGMEIHTFGTREESTAEFAEDGGNVTSIVLSLSTVFVQRMH